MSVGINLPIPDPWAIEQNRAIRSDNIANNRNNLLWEQKKHKDAIEWNWRNYNAQQNKITNLAKDAKNAGISLMAALGSGGASPVNISMPSGQGGRVSGNYQRPTLPGIQATADTTPSKVQHLQTLSLEEDVRGKRLDNAIRNLNWQEKYNQIYNVGDPDLDPLYVRLNNNYDEAAQWVTEGGFPVLNPNYNMEMNESVGSYYFFKPRPEGFTNQLLE